MRSYIARPPQFPNPARRSGREVGVSPRTRVSLFILLLLGLHALPVLSYQGERQTRWPFLAWAMYARSYPPGPVDMDVRRVVATFASGRRGQVTANEVGLPGPAFRKIYVTPIFKGDTAPAQQLISRLNAHASDRVVELRYEGERYELGDSGVTKQPLPVLTFHAPASGR